MDNDTDALLATEVSADDSNFDSAFFDTKAPFELWLEKLGPRQPISSPRSRGQLVDHQTADFVVQCGEGTDCHISFEGVLRLEGLFSGNIHSDGGTLLTGCGIIEGNIGVGAAFIEGLVTGNIRAIERVVLHGRAKVWGNIISAALSIKDGAQLEGDCILHESIARHPVPPNRGVAGEFVDEFQGLF